MAKKTPKVLTTEEQLAQIGVAKSVPQTMMAMLDKNRLMFSDLYEQLEDEGYTIVNDKGDTVINPKFIVLRDTQKMYNDTVRAVVSVADIVESKRLRPLEDAKGKKAPKGMEIEFNDYSQPKDETPPEPELSIAEQVQAMKEQKMKILPKDKGGKRG